MKKNKLFLILAVVLGLLTIIFFVNRNNGTIRKELMDFAVKDTAGITRIFLADRNGNTVRLDRQADASWRVNDSLDADKFMMRNLLTAIYRLDVRTRVAKSAYNNVIKNLSTSAVKCEIYLHGSGDPSKIYYVGHETQDALGTFMMLENSNAPFVMEIPGFNGYLTPRYSTNIKDWRNKILVHVPAEKIKSVTVNYPALPDRQGNTYRVSSPVNKGTISHTDTAAVDNYLSFFNLIYFENWDGDPGTHQHDSLLQTTPVCEISVLDNDGKHTDLSVYPMPLSQGSLVQTDSLGQLLKYDVDHIYVHMRSTNELVTVQHAAIDRIFRNMNDFDLDRRNAPKKSR